MKMAPLLCLGTPLGNWLDLAKSLPAEGASADQAVFESWIRSTLDAGTTTEQELCLTLAARGHNGPAFNPSPGALPALTSESPILVSPLACWCVDLWLEQLPQARVLAFYEPPAQMLARCLADGAQASPDELLLIWETAAKRLLASLRRHRNRVFLLNADACRAAPEAFPSWLKHTLAVSFAGAPLPDPSPSDPLLLALSETLCASNLKLLPLLQECEASLQPLVPGEPLPPGESAPGLLREALAAAVSLKRDGTQARLDLASLQTQATAFHAERESARQRTDALETELAETREAAAQKHKEASGVHEMLLLEVHNAHKESEDFFEQLLQAQEASKAATAEAQTVRADLANAQAHAAALTGELASARQRTSALEAELAETRQAAAQKHEEASSIHEMLLLEIHNAHKESEDFFERWKKAETLHCQLSLKADRLVRGPIQDHSVHRHLQFSLHEAELFGRHWPRLDFRLVLHNGNAGIAIFLPPHAPTPPLYTWEPSGTENGAPYVLFVPSDSKARRALVAANTHDFLLLRDAVSLLAANLRFDGAPSHSKTDWSHTASLLLEELADLPERLHYDAVYSKISHPSPGEPSLQFTVVQAFFRGILHPSLDCSWSPSPKSGGMLTLRRTPETPPPRLHWPAAPDGSPALEWRLDFGNATPLKARRKLWSRLSSAEKAFLRLLISEIPNFVFHLLREHPKAGLNQESLSRQARTLLAQAKQLSRRPGPVARLRIALSK